MGKGLARATLAVLIAAASVAAIATTASAAPDDVFGFVVVFDQNVGSPTGQIDADYLILKGNGEVEFSLLGQNFTQGSSQRISIHKGTCAAPGDDVDVFEVNPGLRLNAGDPNPRVIATADAGRDGTPGTLRYSPYTDGSDPTTIDSNDIPTFEDDYVIVVDEVGTDTTDYFCGAPASREIVGNAQGFGTPKPLFFKELNGSGVSATGVATLFGNGVFFDISYTGLSNTTSPAAHFQVLRQSATCPSGDTVQPLAVGGSVQFALTEGVRSVLPADALSSASFNVHPASNANGTMGYGAFLPLTFTQRQNFDSSIIVIHGFDQNGNGASDGGASPYGGTLTSDDTAVAGCGQFVAFPATAPDAPKNLVVTASRSNVSVSWSAPTDDGGATITGYKVTLGTGDTKTVTGLQAEFTDIPPGVTSVTVVAINSEGNSSPVTGSINVPRDCQDGDLDEGWDTIVVTSADGSLFRLYCGYFLRYPDQKGFAYWQGIQAGGADLILISDQFALSAEFQNTYGQLNNDQFVRLLYTNVLLRPVDDKGYTYWKGLLDTNQLTQGGTMRWVTEGTEFQRVTGTP